jgi:AcrR family transcriptional regulator
MTKPLPPPAVKPLKRPSQARAKFTVQAIYDAFVRIWQRDGWERLTTRAVALETGISVGTLYDYFPNKLALLSGYVRHSIEVLLAAVDREAVQPPGLSWQQRVHQLVRLMCGVDAPELTWFHPQMLALEAQMAQGKHHRRVHEELIAAWHRALDACHDLPARPSPQTVQAMHLALWGGRRYALLLELDEAHAREWAAQMERMCCTMVSGQSTVA